MSGGIVSARKDNIHAYSVAKSSLFNSRSVGGDQPPASFVLRIALGLEPIEFHRIGMGVLQAIRNGCFPVEALIRELDEFDPRS